MRTCTYLRILIKPLTPHVIRRRQSLFAGNRPKDPLLWMRASISLPEHSHIFNSIGTWKTAVLPKKELSKQAYANLNLMSCHRDYSWSCVSLHMNFDAVVLPQ